MTIKEVIKGSTGMIDISDVAIETILINRSVNGAVDYTISHKRDVELCIADALFEQLVNPSFREGDLSVNYSKDAMYKRAYSLYLKHNELDKIEELDQINTPPQIWGVKW
jgi:hypothetical protein